jgi:hypothetical protein
MSRLPIDEGRTKKGVASQAHDTKYDRSTLKQLSFRRQFVLGPRFLEQLSHWQRLSVGASLHIAVHPDLEVNHIAKNNNSMTLLGYILDPASPTATNRDILKGLVDKLEMCDGIADYTARFGGRWLLIVNDGRRTVLFADAAGLRQVCFTTGRVGRIWCASQPALLAELLELRVSEDALHFMEVDGYANDGKLSWYPGDTTPYEAVRQLLPNRYLDLNTGEVRRYWPNANLPVVSPKAGVMASLNILRGLMESARNRFDLAVSLTAGWDSRITLATTAPFGREIFYFTEIFGELTEDHRDVKIPFRLLSKLGLTNNIVECRDGFDEQFAEIYRRNVVMGHAVYGRVSQGLFDQVPEQRICVKGDVAEIVKCYYRLGRSRCDDITAHDLARLAEMAADPFVIKAFGQWLSDARPHLHNVHVLDLFFWEQEAGRLHAMIEAECDIAQDTFAPFNCRNLLTTMLSVPERHRQAPEFDFFRMLLKRAWPDALKEPINSRAQVGVEATVRHSLARMGLLPFVTGPIKRLQKAAGIIMHLVGG